MGFALGLESGALQTPCRARIIYSDMSPLVEAPLKANRSGRISLVADKAPAWEKQSGLLTHLDAQLGCGPRESH